MDEVIGKKLYIIGIGGTGCNIVAAIAMRVEQTKSSKVAKIWATGFMEDCVMLDTNIAGPRDTWIAEKEGWTTDEIAAFCSIGGERAGAGNDWVYAKRLMEAEVVENGPIENKIERVSIRNAQGVMVVHSVTQGTGCGASPVLVDYLKREGLAGYDKDKKPSPGPMYSATVLPAKHELEDGTRYINCIAGLARIAKTCDAVILFDNESLKRNMGNGIVAIENIKKYNSGYGELNNPLVAFLEGLARTNIPDLRDFFVPVKRNREYHGGVICAPVHGVHTGADFGDSHVKREGYLENLLINTITDGRLVTCDPKTAIGGRFVFHVPNDTAAEQVTKIIEDRTFYDMIRGEMFLNDPEKDPKKMKKILAYPPIRSPYPNIHLWGILWNPKIEGLEAMYNYIKEDETARQETEEIWDDIETLLKNLGERR